MKAIGIVIAAVWGILASAVNGVITNHAIRKQRSSDVTKASLLRMLVDIAALAVIYLMKDVLPFDYVSMIIAAAVAMSVGTVVFSFILSKRIKNK